MPYSAWTKLKMPLDLDGSMVIWNTGGFATPYSILSAADMAQLSGESPAKDVNSAIAWAPGGSVFVVTLFPELRDISGILIRTGSVGGAQSGLVIATSTDTTNGLDGTWTTCTVTGTALFSTTNADWWRANLPATLNNNNGVKAVRFTMTNPGGGNITTAFIRGLHVFGKKTSGQTPKDVLFLDSDGATESTSDFDYGDIAAGGLTSDATVYVKNASANSVANNIVLSFTGSNPGDLLMSTDDGANFFTTRTITELPPGTTQKVIVRLTTPSVVGGNATPRAANLKAAVTTWQYYVGRASETDTARTITPA